MGSVIMYPSGRVFSSGYEYFDTPIMNPAETKTLNQAAERGYNHFTTTDDDTSNSKSNSKSESGVVLPHHKYRGYHSRDLRISPNNQDSNQDSNEDSNNKQDSENNELVSSYGVSRHCMLLSRNTFFDLHGFDIGYTSAYEDADLALRLLMKYNQLSSSASLVVTASRSRVVSMNPEGYPELDNS